MVKMIILDMMASIALSMNFSGSISPTHPSAFYINRDGENALFQLLISALIPINIVAQRQ